MRGSPAAAPLSSPRQHRSIFAAPLGTSERSPTHHGQRGRHRAEAAHARAQVQSLPEQDIRPTAPAAEHAPGLPLRSAMRDAKARAAATIYALAER